MTTSSVRVIPASDAPSARLAARRAFLDLLEGQRTVAADRLSAADDAYEGVVRMTQALAHRAADWWPTQHNPF